MPALGFDPAPGDVASLNALARRYGEIAAEVTSVQAQVAKIDLSRWEGKTAVAVRARRDILAQTLGQAADAAAKFGDAAARWSPGSSATRPRPTPWNARPPARRPTTRTSPPRRRRSPSWAAT